MGNNKNKLTQVNFFNDLTAFAECVRPFGRTSTQRYGLCNRAGFETQQDGRGQTILYCPPRRRCSYLVGDVPSGFEDPSGSAGKLVAALSILELTGMPLAADTRRGVLCAEAQFINTFCAGNVSKPVALYTRFCKISQVRVRLD